MGLPATNVIPLSRGADRACVKCAETKPVEEFKPNKRNRTGFHGPCRACLKAGRVAYKVHAGEFKCCTKCQETKAIKFFAKNIVSRDGRVNICRACVNAYTKKRYQTLPKKTKAEARAAWLWFNYRLTQGKFDAMMEAQGGVCAICLIAPQHGKFLCVDHHHSSGKVRGLLCERCNTGLGMFRDSTLAFRRASQYLDRFEKEEAV